MFRSGIVRAVSHLAAPKGLPITASSVSFIRGYANQQKSEIASVLEQEEQRTVAIPYSRFNELTTTEKVVEGTKDVSSFSIILLGVGLAGTFLYNIVDYLFVAEGPADVFQKAFKRIKEEDELADVLGIELTPEALTSKGEPKKKAEYRSGGYTHLRMVFDIRGETGRVGKVNLEVKKPDKGGKYK